MGNQCNNVTDKSEYQLIQELLHPTFGKMYHLRNQTANKDVGVVKFQYQTHRAMSEHMHKIELAQQYSNIPTLIKINSYEEVGTNNKNSTINNTYSLGSFNKSEQLSCIGNRSALLMHFQYFEVDQSFEFKFKKCQKQITDYLSKKINKNIIQEVSHIKLCDYKKIDKLPFKQRRFINFYYQQIQILRMIDLITGALFVLMHFNIKHGGVRPDMMVFDKQDKVVLVDCQIFMKETNYEVSLGRFNQYLSNSKQIKMQQIVQYVAPQLLNDLSNMKNLSIQSQATQKGNIFSLGLMMIQCCLLNKVNVYQCFLHNSKTQSNQIQFKINRESLIKSLALIKKKYSQNFVQLLVKMTQIQPQNRISYSQLIDQLNILVNKNLSNLRAVYLDDEQNEQNEDIVFQLKESQNQSQKSANSSNKQTVCTQLTQKLQKMEYRIQKVLGKKLMFNEKIDVEELEKDQKRILKELERVSRLAQSKNSIKTGTSFDQNFKSFHRNASTLQNSHEISKNHSVDFNFTQKFNGTPSTVSKRLNSSAKMKKNKMQQSMKNQQKVGNSTIVETIPLVKQKKTLNKKTSNFRQLKGNQLYQLYLKQYNNIKLSRPRKE